MKSKLQYPATTAEVCHVTGLSEDRVRGLIRRNRIPKPAIDLSGMMRWGVEDVQKLVSFVTEPKAKK